MSGTRVRYIEYCGGCHGVSGVSAPTLVPRLQGQVSYFACIPEGRGYLARLPNIALSRFSDEEVASLLNFLVFDMGAVGGNRLKIVPYTAREVNSLRRKPLTASLLKYRSKIVEMIIARCAAPTSLRDYGGYAIDPGHGT